MRKKFLFFDIDGTLLSHTTEEGVVSDSTFEALAKLKENGHFIALATGRAHFITHELAENFGINNIVYEGGNGVIVDGENIHYELIDQEAIRNVISHFEKNGLMWGISNKDKFEIVTPHKKFYDQLSSLSYPRDLVYDKDYDYRTETNAKRVFVENKKDILNKINEIEDVGFMHYPGSPYAIIEPDDKYKGIKRMLDVIGANEEDVIVFGDGLNDIKMFKQAAYSVAMGNAEEELKEIADYVTNDIDEDGIYNACRYLGLFN